MECAAQYAPRISETEGLSGLYCALQMRVCYALHLEAVDTPPVLFKDPKGGHSSLFLWLVAPPVVHSVHPICHFWGVFSLRDSAYSAVF